MRAALGCCLLAACYQAATVTPCTLTCDEAPCPGDLVCGSDQLCQAPGAPLCSLAGGGEVLVTAPNADPGDRFGASVAVTIDGIWLAVGAPGEASNGSQADNSLAAAGAVYIFKWDGAAYVFSSYLKSPSPDAGDQFGASVAFAGNGNVLAVGTPFEDGGGAAETGDPADDSSPDSGAVFVFARTGPLAPWVQTFYVKEATNTSAGRFGASVALSDDGKLIAIGAAGVSHRAYQLRLDPLSGQATPVGGEAGDNIGGSVALSRDGGTVLAGGDLEDGSATGCDGDATSNAAADAGAVFLLTQNGAQAHYCKASNTGAGDRFGSGVACDATIDVFAVGADGEDGNGTAETDNSAPDAGAVYVFSRTGLASWAQSAYLKVPGAQPGEGLGGAVAVAGDGAFLVAGAAGGAGGVHTFENAAGTWTHLAHLTAPDGAAGDALGSAVGVSDDHEVIAGGAPHRAGDTGAVYVFR